MCAFERSEKGMEFIMTKKEILRKVWSVLSWLIIFYVTLKFLFGKSDALSTVCMIGLALYLLLIAIQKIVKKFANYKVYKEYEEGFKYLKSIHAARYRLYFTGTRKDVEAYSAEIERYGNAILSIGEDDISNNRLNKKTITKVMKILDQTRKLMSTPFVN